MKKRVKEEEIGILGGCGEVGRALARFFKKPRIRDIKLPNKGDSLEGVKIIHIAIPYLSEEQFIEAVKEEMERIKPELVIIHSTVGIGVTRKLGKNVVHSPVRGVHPNLFEGLKTFVKFVGANDKKYGEMAKKHLQDIGIKRVKVVYPSETTEIAKLLDTTYYGLCIAFHGEAKELCDKYGVDFEIVMTEFNKTYNEGYKKLGKPNVIRPVLYPPQRTGGIGGHCIIPNAEILKNYMSSPAIDLVLKYKKIENPAKKEKEKNKEKGK